MRERERESESESEYTDLVNFGLRTVGARDRHHLVDTSTHRAARESLSVAASVEMVVFTRKERGREGERERRDMQFGVVSEKVKVPCYPLLHVRSPQSQPFARVRLTERDVVQEVAAEAPLLRAVVAGGPGEAVAVRVPL